MCVSGIPIAEQQCVTVFSSIHDYNEWLGVFKRHIQQYFSYIYIVTGQLSSFQIYRQNNADMG